MAPRNGQRGSRFTSEQVVWYALRVAIIGLLLLVLLISVQSLGDPHPSVEAVPVERARAPLGEPSARDHSAVGRGQTPTDRSVAIR